MPRYSWLAAALWLTVSGSTIGCCSWRCGEATAEPVAMGPVLHVVVCWLDEPGDPEARQELIDGSLALAAIPGVIEISAGVSIPSDRAVVDDSFDVAIVMSFESGEALQSYLEHPRHEKAVRETLAPLVRRMIVYDLATGLAEPEPR